jgi:hypothetical protein
MITHGVSLFDGVVGFLVATREITLEKFLTGLFSDDLGR